MSPHGFFITFSSPILPFSTAALSSYRNPCSLLHLEKPIHLQPMELLLHSTLAPLASVRSSAISPFNTLSNRRVSLETYPPRLGNVLSSQSENWGCAKRDVRRKKSGLRAATPDSVDVQKSSPPSQDALGSAAQSHLDLLERMTQNSSAAPGKEGQTIAEQLANQVEAEAEGVVISLSNVEKRSSVQEPLTVSQKRNIRRQDYLNKVSERNDAPLFATVAAFVLLPPVCILGFAIATGYVELFP